MGVSVCDRVSVCVFYLAVLSYAVHGVLVVAELHAVHLSVVSLPAYSALTLLHV